MSFYRKASLNLGVAGELLAFLRGNKRWWLQPMLIVLFLFAVLMVLAQSSAVAPFIYALY
mgnify:CR=1 FL=1